MTKEEILKPLIRNHRNVNSIMNTNDYISYEDVLKAMEKYATLKNIPSSQVIIDRHQAATKIIHRLDQYGRSVHSVEYGLPIDPDIPDYENGRGKAMVDIVKTVLDDL